MHSSRLHASLLDSSNDARVTIGPYNILAFAAPLTDKAYVATDPSTISLYDVKSGWGNGAHPTTKLCLAFILKHVQPGHIVLDYGTGSGILSILAAKQGARCIAVDIDEDSLLACRDNAKANGVSVEVVHTRSVYVGGDLPLADCTVANILPGALNRLSSVLLMLTRPGGVIALSGIRPEQLGAIQRIYGPYVDMNSQQTTQQSHDIYGEWVLWSAMTRVLGEEEKQQLRDKLSTASVEECH
ncbi:ribosomal protein L11 methyltransferase-domain-containing protein [Ochromonadaceae sp. CCMP2298]|nr:ribosomal protein L11 methyltransferase-domain-containing protein [Ochromonadaceae sp. CCMP2298]